jgi:hypothetical protein
VFGFVLALTAVLDGLLRLVIREPARRALAATVLLLFALAYGHLDVGLLEGRVHNTILMPVVVFGAVLPALWVVMRLRAAPRLAPFLQASAVALVALQLFTIGRQQLARGRAHGPSAGSPTASASEAASASRRPDIYYLIFDGYTRADILREYYAYDNSAFLDGLRARGFFVATEARSNYVHTRLSLASTLNMRYLDAEARRVGPGATDWDAVVPLVRRPAAMERLRQLGYRYRNVGGYWHVTRSSPLADENVSFLPDYAEEFVTVFLQTTAFDPMLRLVPAYRDLFHPGLVHLKQLHSIPRPKGRSGPLFTFAHVMCPHPPYVFDSKGLVRSAGSSLTNWRTKAYAEQVAFLNQEILKLIDAIDQASGQDAVVIMHGDHGARTLGNPWRGSPEQILEQVAILNAYRLPPDAATLLYPSITPVNSFRVLFTGVFGDPGLSPLKDHSFFSPQERMFDLQEVDASAHLMSAESARESAGRTDQGPPPL